MSLLLVHLGAQTPQVLRLLRSAMSSFAGSTFAGPFFIVEPSAMFFLELFNIPLNVG